MLRNLIGGRSVAASFIGLLCLSAPLIAAPAARLTLPIDESRRVELKGQVHRALAESTDLGEADRTLAASHIIMLLRASPAQEADLDQYLRNLQTRGHPDYHRWLTPQAFGQRFGVAPADMAVVHRWLESKGFRVEEEPVGGRSIVFSGSLGALNDAFAIRMHRYRWRGQAHLANAANPTIPQALAGVVAGFASLHDFRHQPQLIKSAVSPQFTAGTAHYLAPGDFATIYDLTGAYAQGVTGSGRAIAVIGRTDVIAQDLVNFRAAFGLSSTLPQIIVNGPDPGVVSGDELESDLDLEWAGAVAPSASIKFVTSASTTLTDGIDLSSAYAVSNNLADVITVSYGACEALGDVSGGTTFYHQLWQQAAADGTSVFVSSGDAGAAGCDAAGAVTATHGLGVNLLCSSPYSTCVGGTAFSADIASPGTYWSSSNSGTNASALQYIGEAVWNQSGSVQGGSALYASGGGASIYFAKPAWQLAMGVPSDGLRDVPDVSLAAAANHDAYLIFSSDNSQKVSNLYGIGGTSAAAPSMAGIAALIAQRQGARQGGLNPVLYALSDLQAGGGAAVFHRITSGTNSVPGQNGFSASTTDPNYNQATGLGSIDGAQLITHWSDAPAATAGLVPLSVAVPSAPFIGSATLSLPASTAWTAVVGAGATGWLSVTPASGTGSAPLTFSVTANTSASPRSGTISVDGQVLTVTQAAGSGSAQALALSTSSVAFGADALGVASGSQRVVLSAVGGGSLTLGAISLIGAASGDFSYSGSCVPGLLLVPGASCYLDVRFDPTATGARNASLQVAVNGAGFTTIGLAGTGTAGASGGGDAPLPLWAYGLLGGLLVGIAGRGRWRRAPLR